MHRHTASVIKNVVLIVLLIVAILVLVVDPLGRQRPAERESTIDRVMKRGVLRVGFSTFKPWAMKDRQGEFVGFEVDVARQFAEDMGVDLELVNTEWSGIIPALQAGKFDIIIGGMSVTPKRNLKVNFSIPYDMSGQAVVAHRELAAGFDSLDDFNDPEVVIAVRIGATSVEAARRTMPKARLKKFDNESFLLQELLAGNVHAVVSSAPLPRQWALTHPEKLFLPFEDTITHEPIGFALPKGDHDTLNVVNNWIRVKKGQGWFEPRHRYWFETLEWEKDL